MTRRRKPDKPTKTLAINVPSEFADMFNYMVYQTRGKDQTRQDAKTQLFIDWLCKGYSEMNHSRDAIKGHIEQYKARQAFIRECYEREI